MKHIVDGQYFTTNVEADYGFTVVCRMTKSEALCAVMRANGRNQLVTPECEYIGNNQNRHITNIQDMSAVLTVYGGLWVYRDGGYFYLMEEPKRG